MIDKATNPGKNKDTNESSPIVDEVTIENNKKAHKLYRGAKRFISLGELGLALENIAEATSLDTTDDGKYNLADAYFLATQTCRRLQQYDNGLKYIEEGIKTVNPYRADSPKFVLAKGVIFLQLRKYEQKNSKIKKYLANAIESFRMAITVAEMLLNQKAKYRFEPKDISVIRRYHQIAIYDMAYAHDLTGNRRESINALDRLFELYPDISIKDSTFDLYNRILKEKKVMHIAK